MRHLSAMALIALMLTAAACSPPQQPTPDAVATFVAATPTAAAPILPSSTETTAPARSGPTGAEGRICPPSGDVTSVEAWLADAATGEVVLALYFSEGESRYQAPLLPGTYLAYSVQLPDHTIAGGYTEAVPCGLGPECGNHALLQFDVTEGATTLNIDLCDWNVEASSLPPPPTAIPTSPPSPTPDNTLPGGIAGSFEFPTGEAPPLVVIAFNFNTGNWRWVGTPAGAGTYEIRGLPAGDYYVVGYAPNGWASCTELGRRILVAGGQTTTGIDLLDWWPADSSTCRARPDGIDYP
jgi:hypothetical protein